MRHIERQKDFLTKNCQQYVVIQNLRLLDTCEFAYCYSRNQEVNSYQL